MAKLGPLPNVAGVCKVRLIGTVNGKPWVNVLHAQFTGGTAQVSDLATFATGVRTAWTTNIAPLCHNYTQLNQVEVTDLTTRTSNQGNDTTSVSGSGGAAISPNSLAACLTLKVVNRYRGGHPRIYLPGVPQANLAGDGATWSTGKASAYTAGGRAFRLAINALTAGSNTWSMCAVGYYVKVGGVETYRNPPIIYTITDVLCHNRVDTMRRRLGKETS